MEIFQEELPFRPITITLESREEALCFFNLIDELDSHETNVDLSSMQQTLLTSLSNARSNLTVNID